MWKDPKTGVVIKDVYVEHDPSICSINKVALNREVRKFKKEFYSKAVFPSTQSYKIWRELIGSRK